MPQPTKPLQSLDELVTAEMLSSTEAEKLRPVAERYAIAITPAMAELIQQNAPGIAAQFMPDAREALHQPFETTDPIGDQSNSPLPGLVHRHRDRVLLKPVTMCPVYCRFCFRRETVGPGEGAMLSSDEMSAALEYIKAHTEIWEVIVTGGDPMVLSPRRITEITSSLAALDHVKVIRWHTRVPVVSPERITHELTKALRSTRQAVFVALHANHPSEITPQARQACATLIDAGIPMISQTVLLKGVNDDTQTLSALMRAFVENRIKPYYLHHGDLAPGTAHFRTSISAGQSIVKTLRHQLSGLCQPTYVLDLPGGHAKVPIDCPRISQSRTTGGDVIYEIDDGSGRIHRYQDKSD